jgi:cell division protease FtsH
MSERLGPQSFVGPNGGHHVLLPSGLGGRALPVSEATAELLDAEVAALVRGAYARARELLHTHRDGLERLATLLRTRETLEGDELRQALADAVGPEAAATATRRSEAS